ncbi:MAG TPA: glycosyltransferase family 1 protein [Planctomycetes bacterium]|nr:glycosyltransferase family 1 protein [Planctomycetota bacterium]
MSRAKRIFIVEDMKEFTGKFLLSGIRKQVKGFIRLGHDVHRFDYGGAFWQVAPIKSTIFSRRWCKEKVDEVLVRQIKSYEPDIVHVSFANFLDVETIALIRQAAPNAFLYGCDGDPWPQFQKNRVPIGAKLDLVLATNDGQWLDEYRKTGVRGAFMPNPCDPDYEYRYDVWDKWKTDILFTGKTRQKHKRYPTDSTRYKIISRLAQMKNCTFYGCLGRPRVGGYDYIYAISGARIALSVGIANDVSMYHSDRLTHYLACGAFVLAKRVPDSDLLFKDGVHLKYFDTADEFFELADWYLKHEDDRIKIADNGMEYVHAEFNGTKIAKYTLDIIENGDYAAPWR